jgi:hypothetical protein
MTEKPEPGPRNKAAIAEAGQTYAERPVRVYIAWGETADGVSRADAPHSDPEGHALQLAGAFGTTSTAFITTQLGALEWATRGRGDKQGATASEVNSGLAIVQAIGPENELEAALAVQMASCHALSTEMLGRARQADSIDHTERFGNLAVKLQRTFTAQLEALARLRGKGQQTVRVEHVTVEAGAQAIIGDVHHQAGGRGRRKKKAHQPHGTRQSEARPALPGANPLGATVPLSGDAERPVPHSRRQVARPAEGQSERAEARALERRGEEAPQPDPGFSPERDGSVGRG